MARRLVAIVGAGLAGLSAALELKEAGCFVHLYERSRLIGGRATSFEVAGHEVDNGQHVFLGCCTEFIRFVNRVGMGDKLQLQERFDVVAIAKNGVRSRLRAAHLPAPLHLIASFLQYRHLQWMARLQVAYALARIKSALASKESFAVWLARNAQGPQTIRAFWEPFVVPALNASLERVSAADAAFVIATAFLDDPGAARFGFSRVPLAHIMQAAAVRADTVHTSAGVLGMESSSAGVRLRLADDAWAEYDAVILAVTPERLARIIGDPARYGIPPLDGYEAKPIIDVHLWFDGPPLDLDFGALLDSPLQWVFQKEAGYLCCSMSAADAYLTAQTADLTALAWRELQSALPELRDATLRESAVTRNPNSTYLPKIGVERPKQATSDPRIAIAGAWTQTGWPDTMESAVRSGISAASVILSGAREAGAVEGPR